MTTTTIQPIDHDCPYEYTLRDGQWSRIDADGRLEPATISIQCRDNDVTVSPPDDIITMQDAQAWVEATWPDGDWGTDGIHIVEVRIQMLDVSDSDEWLIDQRRVAVRCGSMGGDDDCLDGESHDWEEVDGSAHMHGGRCSSYAETCTRCGARRRVYHDQDDRYVGPIQWAEPE